METEDEVDVTRPMMDSMIESESKNSLVVGSLVVRRTAINIPTCSLLGIR